MWNNPPLMQNFLVVSRAFNPDFAFGQDEIGFRHQAAGFRQRIASHRIVLLVMRT